MSICNLQAHLLEKIKFNISELINNIVKKYNNSNIQSNLKPQIYINGEKSHPKMWTTWLIMQLNTVTK